MGLNPAFQRTATRLIARFGRTVEIVRPGEPTDDGYGNEIPGEATVYPATAATIDATVVLAHQQSGSLEPGDMRVLVSTDGLPIEPDTSDALRMDGEDWIIIAVAQLATDGEPLFYDLRVGR
ncbi:hypothetical protein RDV64_03280 [Acuticoccus sp. MNP-M23]|uniref:hypothetical protein n=1 Tax=Acuticoccus sp. MNP-M23 TaxID=3072793 RepID=UPI0028164945|nr:hypothetical protein [Acuticoccus sp. MNP-M23]WMS43440.1 hypothetical protein RDV64_03280 [Acuticoccus sp. MNP-M23]